MKIGIVTQPLLTNYGGILQNYALQQVLKSLGHTPVTLDFMPAYTGLKGLYKFSRATASYMLGRLKDFQVVRNIYGRKRQNKEIIAFVDRFISHTEYFWNGYSPDLIKGNDLEALIVGSDQTWRPLYNGEWLKSMFFDFAEDYDIPKIAYAASFGTAEWEYTDALAEEVRPLLKKFTAVSVREKSGTSLAERLGFKAVSVLDPTLLLGRDGFEKILPDCESTESLGAYILDSTENTRTVLEQISERKCCSQVNIFSEGHEGMGPLEWINAIRSSKFFITDSFHGTVFCILFHVPFLTVINSERGADRFQSLMKPLELENHLITSLEKAADNGINKIEWERVDEFLATERASSLSFLEKGLNLKQNG